MELRELGLVLRRGWWLILAGIVLGVGGGGAICFLMTPTYESTTQFFVATPNSTDSNNNSALQGGVFSQQRAQSYTRLLSGPDMTSRVIDRLGLPMSNEDLAENIEATADLQSVLIDVTVTDESATRAQAIAETIGLEFPDLVEELETAGRPELSAPVAVLVTGQPEVSDEWASPQVLLILLIGAGVGLVLGFGAAIARGQLDRSVKDPAEAGELGGAAVIGTIVRDASLSKRHVLAEDLRSATGESFRQLRNNLQFLSVDEPPKVIMISSSLPSEGKTTTAINLGLALARAGRKVVIVDADLRAPRVSSYLDLVEGAGVTSVLSGAAELEDVLQRYGDADGECAVLAAGPTPPNPSELLASGNMGAMLGTLRDAYDYVIVDSAPLLAAADSTGLATHADGVLLTVQFGRTRKDELRRAVDALQRVGGRVLGIVFNSVPPRSDLVKSFGYAYGYGATAGDKKSKKAKKHAKADTDRKADTAAPASEPSDRAPETADVG
ncbi:polysaccharide biosynthesis tyrosine autokinase [Trujillonella endophytica]|uniref:Capsular exopolysaccharide family n=1 Tax=Trujillonella endophytica TaxID=673521 RepID=A0A1H8W5Q2_9ACTN|nr:polysaccharide biosynthesis tyrosine autokinase [Trujillella endophytica]SEP22757.1 capsular exopolysaccharide family [Trujillella endophytica]